MTPAFDPAACLASDWMATPDMALRTAIAAGLLAVGGWASARRPFPGQPAFVALTAVMAAWIFISVTEHAAVDAACKGTVSTASWLVIVCQPMLYTLFLVQYTNSQYRLPPWRPMLMLALPSLVLAALALTNGSHALFYGPATTLGSPVLGMRRLHYQYQPAFYLTVALNYAWIVAAVLLVLRTLASVSARQRRQWLMFLLMMLVPLAANVAYVFFGWRLWGADPTSTGFAVAVLGFAWLIRRDRLFAVAPVARRLLFAELPDPLIVLDAEGRVIDANEAALRLVPAGVQPVDRLLSDWPRLGPALEAQLRAPVPVMALADPDAWFEVQVRRMGRPDAVIGTLVQLHDVSTRHLAHTEAVRSLAARQQELDKATALQALLREQAMHDPLTGLLNRRALDEHFAHEAGDADTPLALVLMDLDHFKQVNDTHGHAAGDAVLRDFAAALRSGLRANDLLFRIGGEEFALLMPGAAAADADRRVASLRGLVSRWRLGQLSEPVTFSAGIAAAAPGRRDLAPLLAAADAALYAAKRGGRDRSALAD